MLPSSKPYLIRAIYEWCIDNGFTPYLAVSVDATTRVPRAYVRDGEIVLNVGPEATQSLQIGNEQVTFQARFNGVAQSIAVPVGRVIAIYARENGQGMAFEAGAEEVADAAEHVAASAASMDANGPEAEATPTTTGRPHLTRIK